MYKITVEDMRPSTDKKNLLFQWLDDASAQSSVDYQTLYWYEDGLGETGTGLVENQTIAILSNNTGTDTRESATGTFYCNPMSTNDKWLIQRGIGQMSSDDDSRTRSWKSATSYASTTAFNGIKFLWSAGNFESGKVRIYGKQK